MGRLKGVAVSPATARRRTEADGAVWAAVQDAQAERVLVAPPPPVAGPAVQQVSVDGAQVPLVTGGWREVRTLAIGTVGPGRQPGEIKTRDLSYFSRLAEAATFTRLASGEVQRRGVETAGVVAGVVDGASWCQGFLDAHRPDAVRILDFPHAVEHLGHAAQAVFGVGTAAAAAWLSACATDLMASEPATILAALRALPVATAADPAAAGAARDAEVAYFAPRLAQIRYAAFRAAGLPLGSGAVESANKVVVEARLKGAGRRWTEAQVNPMVALRGALCSGRWDETWGEVRQARRTQATTRARQRRLARRPARPVPVPPPPPRQSPRPAIGRLPRGGPKRIINGRPTAAHPWQRAHRPPQAPPTPSPAKP